MLVHPEAGSLIHFDLPVYNRIAIALDFSNDDQKLISHALGQGNPSTEYLLIHVVESATSRIMDEFTDDLETRKDQQQLESYVQQMKDKNIAVISVLGYNERAREIARISMENKAEMLVIGAHGHKGLKDFIYGHTIDAVRHELRIPVLVVNL